MPNSAHEQVVEFSQHLLSNLRKPRGEYEGRKALSSGKNLAARFTGAAQSEERRTFNIQHRMFN
jgi:hypothetical protein